MWGKVKRISQYYQQNTVWQSNGVYQQKINNNQSLGKKGKQAEIGGNRVTVLATKCSVATRCSVANKHSVATRCSVTTKYGVATKCNMATKCNVTTKEPQ